MGCNCGDSPDTKECIHKIDCAIAKLKRARQAARCGNLEEAEHWIVGSLRFTREALRCITPSEQPAACDPTGAIPLTSGLNGAPSGTSNLLPGNKYVSPFGLVITWTGNTITVCEVPGNESNVWSLSGAPLILTSGDLTQQRVPSLGGNPQGAAVGMNEGTILVLTASEVNGPVTSARYVSIPVVQESSAYQGFDTNAIEFYLSSNGRTLLDSGYSLNEMIGV